MLHMKMGPKLAFLLLFCSFAPLQKCAHAGWDWQTLPTGQHAKDIFFVTPDIGWIVGGSETILRTTDAGNSWQVQSNIIKNQSETFTFYHVFFISPQVGWITGTDGTGAPETYGKGVVLHTVDGGITWIQNDIQNENSFGAIYFVDKKVGWMFSFSGELFNTTNGGLDWVNKNINFGKVYGASNMQFVGNREGWIVANPIMAHTSNAGQDWEITVPEQSLNDLSFVDEKNGWAVGGGGAIVHTEDGGNTWNKQFSDTYYDLIAVHFVSATSGWAVGWAWMVHMGMYTYYSIILHTTNGGKSWQRNQPPPGRLDGVYFTDANTGWVLSDSAVYHTTDAGGTVSITSDKFPRRINKASYIDFSSIGFGSTMLNFNREEAATIRIYSLNGTLIKSFRNTNGSSVLWSSGTNSGRYIIQLESPNRVISKKLILK